MKALNKLKQTLSDWHSDGTDPRKNDVWRVLLFSFNYAGGSAITIMMGKWSYYTQNVLQLGILFASVHLPIRLLDAVTDPLIANLFDRYVKEGKFRRFMVAGALLSLCLELCQLPFFERATDVDDLLLNTLGCAIGYGIWALWRAIADLRNRQKKGTQ